MNGFWFVFLLGIISIAALGVTDYHAREAQDDYYDPRRSGERPGTFIGRAARLLGFKGTISRRQHRKLIRGFDPTTGAALRKSAGRRKQGAGFDIVLSAPKSFSVLWALTTDPATRRKLERAFLLSVRQTVRRIEAATFTRVGRKGETVAALPLIVCYIHTTSRAGDPQIHAHLVAFNIAVRDDGKTGALLSRPFFVRKMTWGALFRCDLARSLRREFPGIEFNTSGFAAEIAGVLDGVMRHFSRRRRDMEAAAPGLASMTAAAKEVLVLQTRPAKQPVAPLTERLDNWQREGQRLRFGQPQIDTLLRRSRLQSVDKPRVLQAAFDNALEQLTQRQSHFTSLELVRFTAQAATGRGVSGRQVERYVERQIKQSRELVRLGKYRGQIRFSTPTVLAEEQRLVDRAAQLAGSPSHTITTLGLAARLSIDSLAAFRRWLALDRDPSLGADQRAAVRSIAARSGQLAVLTAVAGARRTETLGRLAELYRATGHSVLTVSPSPAAARRLGDATDTPATLLDTLLHLADRDRSLVAGAKHAAKQLVREAVGRYIGLHPFRRQPLLDDKTVLVVDVAQRISTQDMTRLLQHVERAGAKIILAGNVDGLQAIDRGIPFAAFARRFPTAALTEVTRPRHAADARNLSRLRHGEVSELLADLAGRGRLHVAATPSAAVTKLLEDWRQAGGAHDPQRHVIFVGTRDAAQQINDLASQCRRADGSTGAPADKLESVILPGGEKLFAGDRIVCTRTSRRYGVASGDLGTVLGVSRRIDVVQVAFDDGRQATLPLAAYPHLTRGYALTVWQAAPAEHTYLLLAGDYDDRQTALAKFSRAGQCTHVYTDRQSAGAELATLARQLAADRKKTLAVEVQAAARSPEQERN